MWSAGTRKNKLFTVLQLRLALRCCCFCALVPTNNCVIIYKDIYAAWAMLSVLNSLCASACVAPELAGCVACVRRLRISLVLSSCLPAFAPSPNVACVASGLSCIFNQNMALPPNLLLRVAGKAYPWLHFPAKLVHTAQEPLVAVEPYLFLRLKIAFAFSLLLKIPPQHQLADPSLTPPASPPSLRTTTTKRVC